jgi:putative hydrolase of HD superfamily
MALVLAEHAEEKVDAAWTIAMLLVHDLVEIDAGDTFLYDETARATQAAREQAAAARIFGLLPADQRARLQALWDEFEAGESPEARFARAIDRLQPLLPNYCTRGGTWTTPGVTKERVIERKQAIAQASPRLYQLTQALIDDAVASGYLAQDDRDL